MAALGEFHRLKLGVRLSIRQGLSEAILESGLQLKGLCTARRYPDDPESKLGCGVG